ncbi:MAG: ABC transporter substrate-binding protein, partial [Desulfobacteraceae bacterium]|nr:ABC transporter substrate-binding protein [Desulfobacteraceae bacterium]
MKNSTIIPVILFLLILCCSTVWADSVKIGLNYPQTGPYSVQGLAQLNAAKMAVEEINTLGGILGKKVIMVTKDTQSKSSISTTNVLEFIDKEKCEMVFGGASSAVAIAGGKAAKSRGKLYFGTLTYSNATTGKEGHKNIFRECNSSWMGAKALATYLKKSELSGRKYFYITANYTWGWTTEESLREFSMTTDMKRHRRKYVPFPGATYKNFSNALAMAQAVKPDVLVLVLFGNDMARALTIVEEMGLKKKFKAIVVPNLTLGMATSAGAKAMEGVIG